MNPIFWTRDWKGGITIHQDGLWGGEKGVVKMKRKSGILCVR